MPTVVARDFIVFLDLCPAFDDINPIVLIIVIPVAISCWNRGCSDQPCFVPDGNRSNSSSLSLVPSDSSSELPSDRTAGFSSSPRTSPSFSFTDFPRWLVFRLSVLFSLRGERRCPPTLGGNPFPDGINIKAKIAQLKRMQKLLRVSGAYVRVEVSV